MYCIEVWLWGTSESFCSFYLPPPYGSVIDIDMDILREYMADTLTAAGNSME